MGSEIVAQLTIDVEFIKHVMAEIWEDTCEDGANFDTWQPSLGDIWVEIIKGDERLGVYRLNSFNGSTFELHAQVLPQYRRQYTQEITDVIHKWIDANCLEWVQKFVAFIPDRFPNVIAYALKSGWSKEGNISKSYKKDGKLYDICIMGITRDELRGLI